MKSFKVKALAACAAAVAILHWIKAVDQSNIVSQVADKASDFIQMFVKFVLATS